ncbi:MAG: D-alanine--D-alanine ligase [Oligoflexia bacterium]|nr:MAG: D-alanine--D-alanine ligase [Oligoflexia bacterium]
MKKTVAIVFGGRSSEHEISMLSSRNVAAALDKNKFDPVLLGISKEGTWYEFPSDDVFSEVQAITDAKLPKNAEPVALMTQSGKPVVYSLNKKSARKIDVAFPVMHGTFGEDGCIQGLFKMMNLPFVGCGVFASAAGMDKEVMKRLLADAHIPSARYLLLTPYKSNSYTEITAKLGSPFFIKPASQGSSVGVHKIKSAADFDSKLKDAFSYDLKVLAEEFIEGREIECSVMGLNHQPKASLPGEVIPTHEFYSYDAKYIDEDGAAIKVPAILTDEQIKKVQDLALQTYQVMGCDGLTRVDFFLKKNGDVYVNEINTIPGFTKISMYPKMWEASGLNYKDLITQLIQIGLEKFQIEAKLNTNYAKN